MLYLLCVKNLLGCHFATALDIKKSGKHYTLEIVASILNDFFLMKHCRVCDFIANRYLRSILNKCLSKGELLHMVQYFTLHLDIL